MSTLHSRNKFSTHRVASIGFLKYISTGLTLHPTVKQRDINTLVNVDLNEKDITILKEYVSINTDSNSNKKQHPDGNIKDLAENSNIILFPAFDLSTKRVEFKNDNARSTTITYEISCHPDHTILLKSILIQIQVLDTTPPSGTHIYFIPYRHQKPNISTESIHGSNRHRTYPNHHEIRNEFRTKRTATRITICHWLRTNLTN